MGHAVHFLSRLERLELPEVEIALWLYRDTELLREVLNWAHIPEGQERVAIGLRHEEGGPHLLVTRGGAFVTCLGPGMSVGGVPVIGRGRFEALVSKVETLRERMAIANALEAPGEKTQDLIGQLGAAGHTMTLEQYLGTSAFVPLIAGTLLKKMIELAEANQTLWGSWSQAAARLGPKLIRRKPEQMLRFWRGLWTPGHLAALLSEHIRDVEVRFAERSGGSLPNLTTPLVRTGFLPTIARGMLLPMQLGKSALPHYKALLRDGKYRCDLFEGAAGLIVIALRHAGLKAQVIKALERGPLGSGRNGEGPKRGDNPFLKQIEEPNYVLDQALKLGHHHWLEWTSRFSSESLFRLQNMNEEQALLFLVTAAHDLPVFFEADPIACAIAAPLATLLAPEEFYLHAEVVEALEHERGEGWALEQTLRLLESYRKANPKEPVRAAHAPGPNEPCSCGSGRKFKRCCMHAAA